MSTEKRALLDGRVGRKPNSRSLPAMTTRKTTAQQKRERKGSMMREFPNTGVLQLRPTGFAQNDGLNRSVEMTKQKRGGLGNFRPPQRFSNTYFFTNSSVL